MVDKTLSVAEWKKFAKGKDLKDAALLKALEVLDKAQKAAPDVQLKALDEIDKQVTLLLKAAKGDKVVSAYLGDMDKALTSERKTLEQAIKDLAKTQAKASSSDEDEDSPAMLTTLMVSLLRQLRKGEVRMSTMIALAPKDMAVLISRKTITPARRKLLADALGVSGGLKYIVGECLFEEGFYTFVVQAPAAGLAKRLKAALLKQTGLRLKVRVRGEGADDLDDEGDEGDEVDTQERDTGTEADSGRTSAPAATPTGGVTAEQLTAAMNKLSPKIKALVTANPALKASLLVPVAAFQEHVKAGRLTQAGAEIKRLAALLASPGASEDPGALDQALGAWTQARIAVLGQLLALEKAIRGMKDPEGDAAIILVKAIQANLTARPDTRQAVAELERYISTDDIIDEAQGPNGFGLTVEIRTPLLAALSKVRAALPA